MRASKIFSFPDLMSVSKSTNMNSEISRRNFLKASLATGLAAILSSAGCDSSSQGANSEDKTSDRKNSLEVEVYEGNSMKHLKVPVYSNDKVPQNNCARYVRYSADNLFNETLPQRDSWDMRYFMRNVAEIEEKNWDESLTELAKNETLKPGMVAGIYNPNSHFKDRKDIKGKQAKYTHVALYIGKNKDGEPLFAEKFVDETRIMSASDYQQAELRVVEILAQKN